MISKLQTLAFLGSLTLLISGCSEEPKSEKQPSFACKQENVLAPKWTCVPLVDGSYAGVGIAQKSSAGMAHMRRVALANGRADLAQQIQTQVKDKVELFTRSTGVAKGETVDKVTTAVSKQVAKVDLTGSKAIDSWNAPSGALFLLVTVDETNVNKKVKDTLKSSFKNDNALWQQFQSKQSLKGLEKEFATKE